jgi:hypothetical protein
MANIAALAGGTVDQNTPGREAYYKEVVIDFAAAATAKGSALAATDTIEAIVVPAGTMILAAGAQMVTAVTGASNDNTLSLGVTGVAAAAFISTVDLDAATAGQHLASAASYRPLLVGGTADTIDILLAAGTTAPTGGRIRVWAILMDVGARRPGGTAKRDVLGNA